MTHMQGRETHQGAYAMTRVKSEEARSVGMLCGVSAGTPVMHDSVGEGGSLGVRRTPVCSRTHSATCQRAEFSPERGFIKKFQVKEMVSTILPIHTAAPFQLHWSNFDDRVPLICHVILTITMPVWV